MNDDSRSIHIADDAMCVTKVYQGSRYGIEEYQHIDDLPDFRNVRGIAEYDGRLSECAGRQLLLT